MVLPWLMGALWRGGPPVYLFLLCISEESPDRFIFWFLGMLVSGVLATPGKVGVPILGKIPAAHFFSGLGLILYRVWYEGAAWCEVVPFNRYVALVTCA